MNSIGIYYAYWTQEWDVDFHPYIEKAASLGYDLVELNGGTVAGLTAAERTSLKSHADEAGLGLSYCVGLPAKLDVSSPDPAIREAGIGFLERMIAGIGEMGGGILGGILYGAWPANPADLDDRGPYFERSVESIQAVADLSAANQVTLCMEVVNRFEQFIINTAEEAVAYVDAVGSPNVKIHLDTFHMNIEEASLEASVRTAGSHLGHLHVGENNRMPPGRGPLDWSGLARALREVKYGGHIVLEPFLRPGGQVGRDIRVYRDLSRGLDLDEEARAALTFIRETIRSASQ